MKATRQNFVDAARKYINVKFGHQGRNPKFCLDCGGLILVVARQLGLTELEYLGYASFPMNGQFEKLLDEHAIKTDFTSTYPHALSGTELLPADLISFDYNNGEGVRHIAVISRFDGKRYWMIDAQNPCVAERPFAHPFSKATIRRYLIKDLAD
jgi:cell wall-associated NlpC family hydrolase